ncbi:ABC transporter ATP-binding protein [Weissella coleopterorum]|uniref:ABC transporter ATP-binding protein n=1 Tax=Weissella coleopterorum TaxID=2714949 RepID=A0A6G8B0P9_9LACO|nr:ABC transporter ATP-binding protein [Weissella coleopterorum]QIL50703.1 ABC transporter ATP-binding protein [Weissella coleopterorum]
MGIILEAQSISKQFGAKKVVKNVDLSINNGEFIAFLGPNGAGKSTMIQLLTTLIPASSGQIKIKGINIQKNKKQLRKNIGIVFQQSILDYDLTVLQNLQLSQQLVHANQRYFNKIVELFKLTNILQQKIATLSGGQRRRVDIAYVLLGQPAILFLDEPTNALDLKTRQLIWRILNDLKQKENMTIFLTTHYLMEAEQADQVYIFDHGEILAHGSVN